MFSCIHSFFFQSYLFRSALFRSFRFQSFLFRLPCLLLFLACCLPMTGCRHEVDLAPVEVKPIHITIDVNVKVDKALDNFFGDIDQAEKNIGGKTTSD